MNPAPRLLDGALVQAFAICDTSVRFTGQTSTNHNGKPVENVPALAIGRDIRSGEIVLFYCDENWKSLGARSFGSVQEAKQQAELECQGIASKWHDTGYTREDLLPEDLEPKCSFCGSPWFEVEGLIKGKDALICYKCVKRAASGDSKIDTEA